VSYRFSSHRMKRIAARAAASDHTSALERRLGMAILAVAPRRRRVRDAIAELDAAIEKAERRMGGNFRCRRRLTPAERQARYEATLERIISIAGVCRPKTRDWFESQTRLVVASRTA